MADLFVVELLNGVSYVYNSKTLQLYKVPVKDFYEEAGSCPSTFSNVCIGYDGRVYLSSTIHRFEHGSFGVNKELYVYNSKKFNLGGKFHTITVLENMSENGYTNDISVDGELLGYDFSGCTAWKDVWLCYVIQYKNYYLFYYKFDNCRFILVFDKYSLLYVIGKDASYIGGIEKEFVKAKISGLVDLFYDMRNVVTDDVLHFKL